jgi:SSS family solute:Na+ symporter
MLRFQACDGDFTMTTLDAGIVLAFVAYSIAVGLRERHRASRSLEEYFLAGRSLGGWSAGISMAATQFAADTPLLVTGLIATGGIFALWRLWIYAVAFLLMGIVLAPSWRRVGVVTDAELCELRYAGSAALWLRGVKAVYFGTVFNCVVLAMVLYAAREITEPFLLWDQWLPHAFFEPLRAMLERAGLVLARTGSTADLATASANNAISLAAIVAVTLLYSTTGGLRSVVRTDVVQFAIMMIATVAYAWFAVERAGGLEEISTALTRRFPEDGEAGIRATELLAFTPSRAKDATFFVLALFGLQWLVQMNADGTGYLAQRSMACRSDRDATGAAVVFTVAQILFRSLVWLPLGLALLVVFPLDSVTPVDVAAREATFVRGMAELLPPGVLGLMLTGMLAALASTVDTHLNWGASYWTNDLFARVICERWLGREPSQRLLVWVARLSNLLLLTIALAVMTQLSSIQTAWHASLLLGAGMGVMLLLRWFWWRVNAWGELAAIVTSALLAPLLLALISPEHEALRLLVVAAAATGAGIAVTLATPAEPVTRLREFYARARPPGFWGPVAMAEGDPTAAGVPRLLSGLTATALAALSVFSLLVGLGTWLVGGTPPAWCTSRGVWVGGLILLGAVAGCLAHRFVRAAIIPVLPLDDRDRGTVRADAS